MNDNPKSAARSWYVYMVRCRDLTLYTGITNDLDRRLKEHNGEGGNGARYTRPRRPVVLVYSEAVTNRQNACRRESALKTLKKPQKERLIQASTAPAL